MLVHNNEVKKHIQNSLHTEIENFILWNIFHIETIAQNLCWVFMLWFFYDVIEYIWNLVVVEFIHKV